MLRHSLPGLVLTSFIAVSLSGVATAGSSTMRSDSSAKPSLETLARRALTNNGESAIAIDTLRSMGPEGLRAFLDANHLEIEAAVNGSPAANDGWSESNADPGKLGRSTKNKQVLAALDSICQQKDCYASKLYWYTNLDQARAAAKAQAKPILSLRLLGRLDEDLSCANSRLFRITLYANEEIAKLLRERFILHWQSVRPVPKLTIDFGDGRKMERTLTGNSIHYVLNSEGQVIDALPGLYGPGAFFRELSRILPAAAELSSLPSKPERDAALRQYHAARLNEIEGAWQDDVKRAGLRSAPSREIPTPTGAAPSAERAATVAVAKAVSIERPILRGMSGSPGVLDSIGSDAGWVMIARRHTKDARLDRSTHALMSFKDPSLTSDSLQLATLVLRRAIAEDTVRNEYVFRTRILRWLAGAAVASDVASLNEKIYSELFLTPSWDAWLGLRWEGAYSGIDDDGLKK